MLQAAIRSLNDLHLTPSGLKALLVDVASLAVGVVPGADGAGVTVFRPGHPDTIVATDSFVARVDAVQYALGQGPCILACEQATTVRSGAVASDPRWPEFATEITALDVGSVLSLPLQTTGQVMGSINLYAHGLDAFSAIAAELGETFAAPAAVAVSNARVIAATATAATELQSVLADRATLDQAIGAVLFTEQVTADEARTMIELRATAYGLTLLEMARSIIDDATEDDDTEDDTEDDDTEDEAPVV